MEKIRGMKLYEPVEFIDRFLMDRLEFTRVPETVAIHITCSMTKMGKADVLRRVAEACAERVFVPSEVGCCGFAGDRGFTYPEMNAFALRKLRRQIQDNGIRHGYSNSRTCELEYQQRHSLPVTGLFGRSVHAPQERLKEVLSTFSTTPACVGSTWAGVVVPVAAC